MSFMSEAASAIKSRFGLQGHSSESFSLVQNTPDVFKSAAKDSIVHSSVVRSVNILDDEGEVEASNAVSSSQSFEFCEDPSFWKDHNVQVGREVK